MCKIQDLYWSMGRLENKYFAFWFWRFSNSVYFWNGRPSKVNKIISMWVTQVNLFHNSSMLLTLWTTTTISFPSLLTKVSWLEILYSRHGSNYPNTTTASYSLAWHKVLIPYHEITLTQCCDICYHMIHFIMFICTFQWSQLWMCN